MASIRDRSDETAQERMNRFKNKAPPILWGVPLPADHRYYIHHYLSDHLQVLCGV